MRKELQMDFMLNIKRSNFMDFMEFMENMEKSP